MTTVERGKALEADARRLLELSGHTTGEQLLGHKKVDLLLESYRFGRRLATAVECKDVEQRLSLTEVATIHAEYQPLVEARSVDEVLVVTRHGLTPAATALIRDAHCFAHLTLQELANSVLDLSSYLVGLRNAYFEATDGLPSYYIPPKTTAGRDLFQVVSHWSTGSDRPMAILGAYGSGKSTFAKHFAATMADAALQDANLRQPILIRLTDISAEQSLEGLLGRTLGATSAVPNYSFDRFTALNQDGRFVVILDGFDEMKRTLSWDEFKYNLEQLNRLVSQRSRVLILGRPTAFLNDAEYDLALRGRYRHGDVVMKLPDWPDYATHSLAPFNEGQISTFLDRYLRHLEGQADPSYSPQALARHERKLEQSIKRQVTRVLDGHLKEIARRPVQLKMLAETLPTWKGPIEDLDTTALYADFIDRIIERDARKITRTRFTTSERREFAKRLAWWMWTTTSKGHITADQIPDDLVTPFCATDENVDAARRDLVAACFLDRAHGGPLVFPHRSFQEFLVAARAVEILKEGNVLLDGVNASLTPEVAEFMAGMVGPVDMRMISFSLRSQYGTMSAFMARLWLDSPEALESLGTTAWTEGTRWNAILLTTAAIGGKNRPLTDQQLAESLIDALKPDVDARFALLMWKCVIQLAGASGDHTLIERVSRRLLKVGTRLQSKDDLPGAFPIASGTPNSYVKPDPAIAAVLAGVSYSERKKVLDLRGSYRTLADQLAGYCALDGSAGDGLPSHPVTIRESSTAEDLARYVEARRAD